ncbi:MAG TPA: MFS transporter [Solirubrobacteraceae bacterium]|nr:MFS transporter [Solirubrobacteraceae bacterium]
MSSPLESARLRRIIAAYSVNRLGTWFGLVALMVAVFDHTHSAFAVAGLLLAWQAVPAFVVPAVVARVEASSRRRELSGLYWFEAVATASLAVLLWHFWLPAILLIAALDGTASLTANSLLRAEVARAGRDWVEELPANVGRSRESLEEEANEAERKANAALNVAFSLSFVIGPAIGGVVVAGAGAPAALFIDVGSFVICGAMLLDLHPHVEEAGGESIRARLSAAWRHVNEVPSLRGLLAMEAVALLFFEAGGPIEVAYAKATLHAGDRGYGLLLTAWGLGAVLGSLVFARLVSRPLAAMLGAGTLAIGAGYVGFAIVPSLALACLAAVVGGIGNGLQWPSLISIVQRLTPQRLQGRMMGGVESLAALCLAVGLLLGGTLVAVSSPRVAFLAVGAGAIATTAALVRRTQQSLSAVAGEADGEAGGPPADASIVLGESLAHESLQD